MAETDQQHGLDAAAEVIENQPIRAGCSLHYGAITSRLRGHRYLGSQPIAGYPRRLQLHVFGASLLACWPKATWTLSYCFVPFIIHGYCLVSVELSKFICYSDRIASVNYNVSTINSHICDRATVTDCRFN